MERAYREHFADAYVDRADPGAYLPFYRRAVELLLDVRRPPGLVVDFGCGWGGLCELLKARGLDYLGVDLSEKEVAFGVERGLRVIQGDLHALEQRREPISALMMMFVFEHLIDFPEFLERCRKLLQPSGVLIILIPTSHLVVPVSRIFSRLRPGRDLPTFGETLTPPWHTVVFSVKGLRTLMDRCGFDVELVAPAPTGERKGLWGLATRLAGPSIGASFKLLGERSPLALGHYFVCRARTVG